MIFDAIKTDTLFKVEAKNLVQEKIQLGLGFLRYDQQYSILINEKLFTIEIIDTSKLNEIDFYFFNRGYTGIVNVIESIRDKIFTMQIIFFAFPVREIFTPIYISIDEKIIETAKKRKLINYNDKIDDLAIRLKNQISFEINGDSYFIVSTGTSIKNEIFNEELSDIKQSIEKINRKKELSAEEKEKYIKVNEEKTEKIEALKNELAFVVHGENLHLPVKKDITQSGDFRFNATKLISFQSNLEKDSLRLIKGDIEFKSGLVSEKIARDLGDIIEDDGSYLKTWDKYLEKEGELLLNKAQKIGVLNIVSKDRNDDGYDLKVDNFSKIEDLLNEGDCLNFLESVPDYITGNLSWSDYITQKEKENEVQIKEMEIPSFKIKKIAHGFITIKTDKIIKDTDIETKKIVLSIYGDEIQLQRKLAARKRLLEGKSANPLLGLIIEDTDKINNYKKSVKIKRLEPLTADVKDKIFKHGEPKQNQIDAIDIALNTPDIAIIQGPPGTGKTTVLTAIIERLNEESDKENIRGQILVAGYQHDAVENIIQRLDINGIPTPKFGKKSETIVDLSSYERIMEWSENIANKVKDQLPELSNHLKIKRLNQYFETYLKTPSKHIAIDLLRYIIDEVGMFLHEKHEKIVSTAKELLNVFNEKSVDNLHELQYIYSLRTTRPGFLDDGKERNIDLLTSNIGKNLNENSKKILREYDVNDLDNYLEKLKKLKFSLIDKLYPKPLFRAEKPKAEIVLLKEDVENCLLNGNSVKDRKNTILASYINELESNPFALQEVVNEYSYVFSATTGQSYQASKQKTNQKDHDAFFDTLIIDEAARVAPMDLLVAMVLAKRRIILVGDHRQLPHMVDEEVIKNSDLSESDFINESMFGYLKKRAKKLEGFDNIKRSITLENQYRTHPLLGKFVSTNFYDKYNEGFQSPLVDIEMFFRQDLKGIENTPAVWIDVPNKLSKEQKAWKRTGEAQVIIEYLRKWILSDEGKDLSFGIISFYRNQKDKIEQLLEKEFLKEERDSFASRLKIGTVDSFQGMEFDIVFLSVVRSRNLNEIKDNIKNYNLFGFLISKNRLCVSMSRQKKSLIVVGDKEFYNTERAKLEVEAIYNFLQLCKSEGKIL